MKTLHAAILYCGLVSPHLLSLLIIIPPLSILGQNRLPALTLSNPHIIGTGYFGTISMGANVQSTTRLNNKAWGPDGNAKIALGLGNPEKLIGLDMRINIYGLTNRQGQHGNFGEGTIDVHLARQLNKNIWLGVGGYDLVGWQTSLPNQLRSYYVGATHIAQVRKDSSYFFSKIYTTIGFGNGRFRTDNDFLLSQSNPFGFFGSLAIQILPEGNLIAEWTGYGLYMGFSVLPFKKYPIQITLGGDDLLHTQRRFVLAGSYGLFLHKTAKLRGYIPPPLPPQMSRV